MIWIFFQLEAHFSQPVQPRPQHAQGAARHEPVEPIALGQTPPVVAPHLGDVLAQLPLSLAEEPRAARWREAADYATDP